MNNALAHALSAALGAAAALGATTLLEHRPPQIVVPVSGTPLGVDVATPLLAAWDAAQATGTVTCSHLAEGPHQGRVYCADGAGAGWLLDGTTADALVGTDGEVSIARDGDRLFVRRRQ